MILNIIMFRSYLLFLHLIIDSGHDTQELVHGWETWQICICHQPYEGQFEVSNPFKWIQCTFDRFTSPITLLFWVSCGLQTLVCLRIVEKFYFTIPNHKQWIGFALKHLYTLLIDYVVTARQSLHVHNPSRTFSNYLKFLIISCCW